MNENIETNVEKLRPFTRILMTIGELPTSYLMSMTYYEQIIWFTKYLQDKVIPAINNNATAVEEIQNFIKTLDLQDEVDHKLDEMVEDGTLEEIIGTYIDSRIARTYNTFNDMINDESLQNNMFVECLGYNSINDGGKSTFYINDTNEVDNYFNIELSNNNVASLIYTSKLNVAQFGIFSNNDVTIKVQYLIDYLFNNGGGTLYFNKGTYLLKNMTLKPKINIIGEGKGISIIKRIDSGTSSQSNTCISIPSYGTTNIIKNITIMQDSSDEYCNGITFDVNTVANANNNLTPLIDSDFIKNTNEDSTYKHTTIEDIAIVNFNGYGLYINNASYTLLINNCYLYGNKKSGIYNNASDSSFTNLYIEHNSEHGFYNNGSNNKISNIKSIWNGEIDSDAYGFYCHGSRNQIDNIECQDNFCNGIGTYGSNNSFTNCLSDCNGYDYEVFIETRERVTNGKAYLYFIDGIQNNFVNCNATQYRTDIDPIAKYSIYENKSSKNNSIDIKTTFYCSTDGEIRINNGILNKSYLSKSDNDVISSNGLQLSNTYSNNAVNLYKNIYLNNRLSFIMDFVYKQGGNYPRLFVLNKDNGDYNDVPLAIIYSNNRIQVAMNKNSTYNLYFTNLTNESNVTLIENTHYRLSIDINLGLNNVGYCSVYLSWIDSNGKLHITNEGNGEATIPSQNANFIFGEINSMCLSCKASDGYSASLIKQIVLSPKLLPKESKYINSNLSEFIDNEMAFTDFTKYIDGYTQITPTIYNNNYGIINGGYKIIGEKVKVDLTLTFNDNAFNSSSNNGGIISSNLPYAKYNSSLNIGCYHNSSNVYPILNAFIINNSIFIACNSSTLEILNGLTIYINGEYYLK